jgi:hypothetical protein
MSMDAFLGSQPMAKEGLTIMRRSRMEQASQERQAEGILHLHLGRPDEPPPGGVMKGDIAIFAFGTRGDFQPYMALALGLRDAGYHVRMYGYCNNVP